MSRRVRGLAVALVSVLCLPVPSDAEDLTLAEAVTRALAKGPDAMIARLETERAGDAASSARSTYWPSLSLSSAAGYSNRMDDKLRAVNAKGVERRYGLATLGSERGWLNVFLHQLVLDMRSWRELQKSEIEADLAAAVEREQREAITYTTLDHYLNVLRLEKLRELDEVRLRYAAALDRQAASMLAAGRALGAEREQVAVHLEEVRLQAELAARGVAEAQSALALAVGMSAEEGPRLRLGQYKIPAPNAGAVTETEALAATPDLRILDLRQRGEELAVLAERANRYPTLALDMGYRHLGSKRYDNFEDEFLVAVDFEVPLFDGFRSRYAIEGANKSAEIARLRYRDMLERKRARVRELAERLKVTSSRPELAERRARTAEERLRVADVNLRVGRAMLDDALNARVAYARDAAEAIEAGFDRILLWATLQREVGTLSNAILGESSAAASR